MKEITLEVGETLRLTVNAKFAEPTEYSLHTPHWQQDDGMGGCLLVRVEKAYGSEDKSDKVVGYWGSDRDNPEWGDDVEAEEPAEIPVAKTLIIGPAYP